MAAQHMPRDLVRPSSGLKGLAQTTKYSAVRCFLTGVPRDSANKRAANFSKLRIALLTVLHTTNHASFKQDRQVISLFTPGTAKYTVAVQLFYLPVAVSCVHNCVAGLCCVEIRKTRVKA